MPPAPVVIDVRNLSLTFATNDGPVNALEGIDLTVHRGEFVSLIGPSGCGKTTLLRVIADLEQPTGGSISVNGVTPEEAGLPRARPEDLKGDDPAHNAEAIRGVLSGMKGPLRDAVLLGAAGALVVAGRAGDLRAGAGMATQSIDSGAAHAALERLVHITNTPAA